MNVQQIKLILKSKLAKSTGITMVGSGLSKLILIIATFICARLLTKNEFGEFSFIRNTLITVLSICALRFGTLCTKYTVEAIKSNVSKIRLLLLLVFSFLISLLIGIALFLLPENLLLSIFDTTGSIFYFRIIGFFLPFFMIQPLIESILRGFMEFKIIAYLQVFMAIFFLLGTSIGIYFYGITGAFIALILYYFIYSIISTYFFIQHKNFAKSLLELRAGLTSECSTLYTMILPTFITSFIDAPMYWICQALLANQCNMASVATMSAIVQLRNTAFIIPTFFFSTYMAFAGQLNTTRKYKEYYLQFNKLILGFILIGIILFCLLSVFAKPLLSLFGSNYINDTEPLYIANFSIPFYLLFSLLNIHMVIREYQRKMLIITICSEILSLTFFISLLNYSLVLPVSAYFISQMVLITTKVLSYYYYFNKDKQKFYFSHD